MPHVAYEEDAAGHIGHTLFVCLLFPAGGYL